SKDCTQSTREAHSSLRARNTTRFFCGGTRILSTRRRVFSLIKLFFLLASVRKRAIPIHFVASSIATRRQGTPTCFSQTISVSASSIALLYKHRWQIELFFKWIKQHLKIKTFWGQSENAVKTQICIALCTYLIVAIIKKQLRFGRNLYEILEIVSVSLFDKTSLVELFSLVDIQIPVKGSENTLPLFGF
ncbi:MAG: transposase, partial [bacterium]|nr:transposase [bacterium]